MRLTDLPGLFLHDIVGKWRRRIIAGGIIAVCAIGIIIECFSAARHALEQSFGPVGARLILAGIFLAAAVVTVAVLLILERRKEKAPAAMKNDERTVLIAEALNLGYTLAQEFGSKRQPTEPVADTPPHSNGAASDDRHPKSSRQSPRETRDE